MDAGSDREGLTATAGGAGVGVVDHESRTFQAFLVIDLCAGQVLEAHGIDHETDAFALDDGVVFGDVFIEGEAILEARAAATGDEDAQLEAIVTLFIDQGLDLDGSPLGELQSHGGKGFDAHVEVLPAYAVIMLNGGIILFSYENGQELASG